MNTGDKPKSFGDLLKNIERKARPAQHALKGRGKAQKIFAEQFAVFAAHASVASLKVGVLTVQTNSSVVFQELEGFQRQKMLEAFRAAGLQIAEVRVKLTV